MLGVRIGTMSPGDTEQPPVWPSTLLGPCTADCLGLARLKTPRLSPSYLAPPHLSPPRPAPPLPTPRRPVALRGRGGAAGTARAAARRADLGGRQQRTAGCAGRAAGGRAGGWQTMEDDSELYSHSEMDLQWFRSELFVPAPWLVASANHASSCSSAADHAAALPPSLPPLSPTPPCTTSPATHATMHCLPSQPTTHCLPAHPLRRWTCPVYTRGRCPASASTACARWWASAQHNTWPSCRSRAAAGWCWIARRPALWEAGPTCSSCVWSAACSPCCLCTIGSPRLESELVHGPTVA